ncbi:MAG: FG-GAP-like repeat-containing protein [Bacteroidota bacterium]
MNKLVALLLFLWSPSLFAQFDSLIFEYDCSPAKYGVVALGDQNHDGYDDILIYDCQANKAMIFFGGNPMSTNPVWQVHIVARSIVALDVNGDGIKDIVIAYQDTIGSTQMGKVNIYYGGSHPDTIPDIHFEAPQGNGWNFGYNMYVLKDFAGDGKSELMISDPSYPFNNISVYGIFYIYKANPVFDTIPYATIKGDTLNNHRLYDYNVTTGDIDGDGLTDVAITGGSWSGAENDFISIYKGNSQWNMTPYVTYYKNEHTFDPTSMKIIQDINGDKKDDILINSYGTFYQYYYLNSILYGSLPIDTIPKIGLNTQNTGILDAVSPGDVNGDGYNDLLVNAAVGFGDSEARLWVGGNPMPDLREQWWGGDDNGYGKLIARVGDVNGDGIPDICVGQAYDGECIGSGFVRIFKGDTSFKQPMTGVKGLNYVPEKFQLDNPYPNPFNPATVISYQLAVRSHVSLKVYDILGKDVAVLVDEDETSGKHESKFDASKYRISSGVYFIKLTSTTKEQTTTATKKMVLTK